MSNFCANEGKKVKIYAYGRYFARYPVVTPIIKSGDSLEEILLPRVSNMLCKGDILFISEKCVACSQGRAIPVEEIKPRKLAVLLSHFVHKSPYGIGLAIPETMEMALRECGTVRILFACAAGVIGKLFGRRGWFYIVAGKSAAAIDGPCTFTIPPYNCCVVLAPQNPDDVCEKLSAAAGCGVAIVDVNDLGADVLATYPSNIDNKLIESALRDNPLGQSCEQTPIGILREVGGVDI